MTIEVRKEIFRDLYRDENWPLFDSERGQRFLSQLPDLGVVSFSAVDDVNRPPDLRYLRRICAEPIQHRLYNNSSFADYTAWLFLAQTEWLPKNRITLYKRLWKSLVSWPLDEFTLGKEVLFESQEGIRFGGLAKVEVETFIKAADFLSPFSALIASKENLDTEEQVGLIFHAAFPEREGVAEARIDWMTLSSILCPRGDLVIRGHYEHPEQAIYIDCYMLTKKIDDFDAPSQLQNDDTEAH